MGPLAILKVAIEDTEYTIAQLEAIRSEIEGRMLAHEPLLGRSKDAAETWRAPSDHGRS